MEKLVQDEGVAVGVGVSLDYPEVRSG